MPQLTLPTHFIMILMFALVVMSINCHLQFEFAIIMLNKCRSTSASLWNLIYMTPYLKCLTLNSCFRPNIDVTVLTKYVHKHNVLK